MNYTVDIPICTYNHEKYIAQAINGVLSQKTNFKFRLLIGEDCSTDNTKKIIQQLALQYPDIIFPYFRKNNLGANENSRLLIAECKSKYVALCDGDDYWTNPLKLQKQVDFLEANPDFAFCYHHVKIIQEDGFINQKLKMKLDQPAISTIENILKLNIWPHINSIVFLRENMPKYPDWLKNCPSGDWGIWAIITGDKKIKYMPETMSVYRQHSEGFWSSNTKFQNATRTLISAAILKKHLVKRRQKKYLYLPIHYAYAELIEYYQSRNLLMTLYYSILSRLLDFNNYVTLKKELLVELSTKELLQRTGLAIKRRLKLNKVSK